MNIRFKKLEHVFFNGSQPRIALSGLDFSIQSGEFVALIGPSGCGKSTLLRLAGDLLKPTRGRIELDGQLPLEMRQNHQVAWMAQSPALLPWLTSRQNVALAQQFMPAARRPQISVSEMLERVGLSDSADAYPFTLSGGMQQRLALARLLALDARLWLMDEPFAALDEMTRERLTGELMELWQPLQPTVLWVTHNIYEAVRLADRVMVMTPAPGRIAGDYPVTLPRPRAENDPGFLNIVATVRAALAGVPVLRSVV